MDIFGMKIKYVDSVVTYQKYLTRLVNTDPTFQQTEYPCNSSAMIYFS